MPLARTSTITAAACQNRSGVAAFNVITLEHAEGIAEGAERAGCPAILQISENAVRFHGGHLRPLAVAAAAVAELSAVPLSVHLDHVEDADLLRQVDGTGISSVMFDASRLDYEANVAATRQVAEWAHARDIWLEAELGEVGGKDGVHAPGARTDPDEAVRAGIVKVNIGTILNVAYTQAVRERLVADAAMVDPRKYVSPARESIARQVARIAAVVAEVRP